MDCMNIWDPPPVSEEEQARRAAIPWRPLEDLYMVPKTKRALAEGRCVDCGAALVVLDTYQVACPTPGCGYAFNYWHWPLLTAPLPPGDPGQG
jgi:hypothetical protein